MVHQPAGSFGRSKCLTGSWQDGCLLGVACWTGEVCLSERLAVVFGAVLLSTASLAHAGRRSGAVVLAGEGFWQYAGIEDNIFDSGDEKVLVGASSRVSSFGGTAVLELKPGSANWFYGVRAHAFSWTFTDLVPSGRSSDVRHRIDSTMLQVGPSATFSLADGRRGRPLEVHGSTGWATGPASRTTSVDDTATSFADGRLYGPYLMVGASWTPAIAKPLWYRAGFSVTAQSLRGDPADAVWVDESDGRESAVLARLNMGLALRKSLSGGKGGKKKGKGKRRRR